MGEKPETFTARDSFISAMRCVASSVTVVLTDGVAGRFGATVSAFSSVSADPPTVLVCLFAESRIAKAVRSNGQFSVNVLPEDCAEIADRFAGRHDNSINDRFLGVEIHADEGAVPTITGATSFVCELEQTVNSGSHLIAIGRVMDVTQGQALPLAYRDGRYQRVVPQERKFSVVN